MTYCEIGFGVAVGVPAGVGVSVGVVAGVGVHGSGVGVPGSGVSVGVGGGVGVPGAGVGVGKQVPGPKISIVLTRSGVGS